MPPHFRHQELPGSRRFIDNEIPSNLDIFEMPDSFDRPKHQEVWPWLARRERFRPHQVLHFVTDLEEPWQGARGRRGHGRFVLKRQGFPEYARGPR